jgi:hypothetical protein
MREYWLGSQHSRSWNPNPVLTGYRDLETDQDRVAYWLELDVLLRELKDGILDWRVVVMVEPEHLTQAHNVIFRHLKQLGYITETDDEIIVTVPGSRERP